MYADSHHQTEVHDADDVDRAINALTEDDMSRLKTAARVWIRGFGLDTVAQDAEDLVAEAMFRTASGRRSWKLGVDFMYHLRMVMRSIVDSWRKSARRRAAAGAAEVRESDRPESDAEPSSEETEEIDPLYDMPSPVPDAARAFIAEDEVRGYLAHFADDEAASAVLEGLWWEMTGPETLERWGLSKRQYEAAVLRIRRYAQRLGGRHGH